MNKSESVKELAKALSKAQKEFKPAIKDSANPFFKSKYADLESVWEAIREPLAKYEISVAQLTRYNNDAKVFVIETLVMHSSGEWVSGEYPLLAKDDSAQAMGSAATYARRYSLAAAVGVVQSDDDGNSASGKAPEPQKKTSMQPSGSTILPENDFWGPNGPPPDAEYGPPQDSAPKEGYKDRPICCGKKMNISKFPNKMTGKIDYYCFTCKRNQPINP